MLRHTDTHALTLTYVDTDPDTEPPLTYSGVEEHILINLIIPRDLETSIDTLMWGHLEPHF